MHDVVHIRCCFGSLLVSFFQTFLTEVTSLALSGAFYFCRYISTLHKFITNTGILLYDVISKHDNVIKWKHFPRYWPFVRGIHQWPVNSPHKGRWRGALMFSLICTWINRWVTNREVGDLRRHRAHYDVIVTIFFYYKWSMFRVLSFEWRLSK